MSANQALTKPQQKALAKLQTLYKRVPGFDCKQHCADCCGPHIQAEVEWLNISIWLKAHNRQELIPTHLACPYLENNRCSIYEVRPMICRLFGVVNTIRCPHDPHPPHSLLDQEAKALLLQVISLLPPSSHGTGE